MKHWRRWMITAALLLASGAAASVLVAWAFAWAKPDDNFVLVDEWPGPVPADWPAPAKLPKRPTGSTLSVLVRPGGERAGTIGSREVVCISTSEQFQYYYGATYGWPLRCMRTDLLREYAGGAHPNGREFDDTVWMRGIALSNQGNSLGVLPSLPVRPVWWALAVNAGLYAAAFGMVAAGVAWVQRRGKATAGRCTQCGYPVGVSVVCTECGRPVA